MKTAASKRLLTAATTAAALAVMALGAAQVHATTVGLDVYYNPSSADTTGLDLVLDITQDNGDFIFKFSNLSDDGSSIINFYFEAGLRGHYLMYGHGTREGTGMPGTNIVRGATPRQPPGGDDISWITNTFSFGAYGKGQNQVVNGIDDPTEMYTIKVLGSEFMSLDDLIDTLVNGRTRVAVGVVGASGDYLAAVTNKMVPVIDEEDDGNGMTGVPTPAAALGGMALLGMLGLARRRQA